MENRFIIAEEEQLKSLIQNAIDQSLLNCGQQISQIKNEKEKQERFYTVKQACKKLGISRPTLTKLEKKFNFEWPRLNRLVRIPAMDIDIMLSKTGLRYVNAI